MSGFSSSLARGFLCLLLPAVMLCLGGCASAPYTGRSQFIIMDESEEMQLGLEASRQILAGEKTETGTARSLRVERIGRKIAQQAERPNFDWQFHTIVADEMNAFCLPGGRVFVYTGFLELVGDNDAELAAIMGHEIAHALARHGAERYSQESVTGLGLSAAALATNIYSGSGYAGMAVQMGGTLAAKLGFLLPYSRLHESEADHIGVILAAKAGYDPRGAVSLWGKMAELDAGKGVPFFLSTHPLSRERQEDLLKIMPEALRYYNP
ncbi:MAG: M48 family metallopeptidase [Deltaproteobacteria bacterium]|jgi:predicted Zn-dependent protease|nr:M48 family metallopeptidase [Deltaproteobacteria bacterium]